MSRRRRLERVFVPQIPDHLSLKTRPVALQHRDTETVVIRVKRVCPKHLHETPILQLL